jgi:hypothetical protein
MLENLRLAYNVALIVAMGFLVVLAGIFTLKWEYKKNGRFSDTSILLFEITCYNYIQNI